LFVSVSLLHSNLGKDAYTVVFCSVDRAKAWACATTQRSAATLRMLALDVSMQKQHSDGALLPVDT